VLLSATGSWTNAEFASILQAARYRFQNSPNFMTALCCTAAPSLGFYGASSATKAESSLPYDPNTLALRSTFNTGGCQYSYEVWLRIDETFPTPGAAAAQASNPWSRISPRMW
jgi:hypothetical protein